MKLTASFIISLPMLCGFPFSALGRDRSHQLFLLENLQFTDFLRESWCFVSICRESFVSVLFTFEKMW